jgi:hypothetical protein
MLSDEFGQWPLMRVVGKRPKQGDWLLRDECTADQPAQAWAVWLVWVVAWRLPFCRKIWIGLSKAEEIDNAAPRHAPRSNDPRQRRSHQKLAFASIESFKPCYRSIVNISV